MIFTVNENALSETQATGDEEHEERQINVGEDDEDDDVYGDDAHEDEEMEQGEIHEEDEPMDEDEEENDEEGGLHDEEDELEGEEDHEMVHDDKHDDEVEHADEEAQEHGQTEENKAELSYSTRGRAPTAEAAVEMTEHGIREMFEELGRVREPSGTGASFLDSLTEEERRTRTRFLPDVEGIHQLRKHEVKSDIALARSLISTTAPTSTRRPRGKRNRGDDDVMEEEEEDGVEPSEDDKVSDSAKVGSITIDLRTATVTLPSSALVAPPPLQNGSGNGDSSESRDNGSVPSSRRWHNQVRSPLVVEAITAFNPPRPPESVGGKKKHRMLRWERRPTDIEDDLNIYRKTVQRTREELQSAERERERVETVNAHLRRHFLSHLAFMNEEWAHLSLEMRKLQEECIKTVNRLSSRMKDRNAMKASQAMEEALLMLKTLGADLGAKGAPMPVVKLENSISGIGGISSASFVDWDRATKISSTELASSWILPGDSVTTPYGEGIVVRVLGASPIGSEKPTLDGNAVHQENGNRLKNGSGTLEPDGPKSDGRGVAQGDKDGTIATTNLSIGEGTKSRLSSILPPRVCVRLTFGEGYFNVDYVSSRTNPATYSDAMLAQRWLKMTETAHVAGENLDVEGMAFVKESAEKLLNDDGGDNDGGKSAALNEMGKGRFLPFGAGLLPTGSGRGGLLAVEPLAEIETGMQAAILGAQGVLGKVRHCIFEIFSLSVLIS